MEDVIGEISQIDKEAFKREEQNTMALAVEKERYENEIAVYREEKLKAAQLHADMIYKTFTDKANVATAKSQAESEQKVNELKEQFSKNENNIIEEVFNTLFSVEKRR